MSKYSGKTVTVNRRPEEIVEKFSDLSQLQAVVDNLPETERNKIGNVAFTTDSIVIATPQVGEITLQVVERNPQQIKMIAKGAPVPLGMAVDLAPSGDDATDLSATIDVDIPAMLRPLVGPQLQKAVDMLTDVVAKVSSK